MFIYTYIYTYICMFIYTYIYTYICIWIYVHYVHVCTYIYMYVCMGIYAKASDTRRIWLFWVKICRWMHCISPLNRALCAYIYTYRYVHTHTHTYIYTHIYAAVHTGLYWVEIWSECIAVSTHISISTQNPHAPLNITVICESYVHIAVSTFSFSFSFRSQKVRGKCVPSPLRFYPVCMCKHTSELWVRVPVYVR